MNKNIFIIYVSDQKKSRKFYSELFETEPVSDEEGMTMFQIPDSELLLGLMPEKGISQILGENIPHPESGNGIPRCEIYIFCEDPDLTFNKAVKLHAKPVSCGCDRSWGDYVSYVSDPDGHILAFAKKS